MEYEKLKEQINQIDKNAHLVTIEDYYCVDVTNCEYDNIDKIYNVLRNIHCDDGKTINYIEYKIKELL